MNGRPGNEAVIKGRPRDRSAMVIGGGPAGLMAAEALCAAGLRVDLYDAMASPGRKFLLAGRGGLNLTHAESSIVFNTRFRERSAQMTSLLQSFDANALRAWSHELGIDTFVGSSQRVFPVGMKATPLLRAWLQRLKTSGVTFHMRHRWLGWHGRPGSAVRFLTPDGEICAAADVVILALGGGSWARLGSDGAWVPILQAQHIDVADLVAANCGFDVAWSKHFIERFAGQPLKSIAASVCDVHGQLHKRAGEMMITATGIEGGLSYAFSAELRDLIATNGHAILNIDLQPMRTIEQVTSAVMHPGGAKSLTSHLRSRIGLRDAKAGLLREVLGKENFTQSESLASAIKTLPLSLRATRPLDQAISSAGGIRFEALNEHLMLTDVPGVFCAGEMLDWEAPTGGYLLTGCFASGLKAGTGAAQWLGRSCE